MCFCMTIYTVLTADCNADFITTFTLDCVHTDSTNDIILKVAHILSSNCFRSPQPPSVRLFKISTAHTQLYVYTEIQIKCTVMWAARAQSVYQLATGWTVRRSSADPGGRTVFFKARVCGRSLAGFAGSKPAGCMDVCVVYCEYKRKAKVQDNQDKDTSTVEVQTEYKRIQKIIPAGDIFRSRPDGPWGPRSVLHNGYGVSFPKVERPGRGVNDPPTSTAEVKERIELYLYSPSVPSWSVLRRTSPFALQ